MPLSPNSLTMRLARTANSARLEGKSPPVCRVGKAGQTRKNTLRKQKQE
jgi:hypothetical protein